MDKNLVKEFLLEKNIIDDEQLMYNYYYKDVEWFAYKISDDTMLYVSYELTPQGLGYSFCVTVKCSKYSFDIKPVFYTNSFGSSSSGEWEDISESLRNKFLSDATRDLKLWTK